VSQIGRLLICPPLSQVLVGDGRPRVHQAAHEPPEEQAAFAGVPTVVAEDEFVQVRVEVLVCDCLFCV